MVDSVDLSVLIVDDVGTVRSFLRQTLTHLGITEVREVGSGQACIDSYELNPATVVFLDIELPDMDGKDVLRKLIERHPEINVVMISAHSTIENVKEAIDSGARGFIVKPFSPKKIAAVLKKFHHFDFSQVS